MWLEILFLIIRLAPEFISLIEKIIDAFRGGKSAHVFDSETLQEVREAAKVKRRTGDAGPLKTVLERIHARLEKP